MQMTQSKASEGSSGASARSATTVASGFTGSMSRTSIRSMLAGSPKRCVYIASWISNTRPRITPDASPWLRRKSSM